jgi:hypothetical protein
MARIAHRFWSDRARRVISLGLFAILLVATLPVWRWTLQQSDYRHFGAIRGALHDFKAKESSTSG